MTEQHDPILQRLLRGFRDLYDSLVRRAIGGQENYGNSWFVRPLAKTIAEAIAEIDDAISYLVQMRVRLTMMLQAPFLALDAPNLGTTVPDLGTLSEAEVLEHLLDEARGEEPEDPDLIEYAPNDPLRITEGGEYQADD